jgi:D-alanyl-D-alanine carboxypeptidase
VDEPALPALEGDLPDLASELERLTGSPSLDGSAYSGSVTARVEEALAAAEIPADIAEGILEAEESPGFLLDLLAVLGGPPALYTLVDGAHPLPRGYEPDGLVPLEGGAYRTARQGIALAAQAAAALEAMAQAAAAGGVTLVVSSGYRSPAQQAAEPLTPGREPGAPLQNQHQTGFALDFAPADDSFAATAAGRWAAANAGRFGWSLSYPRGREAATGYPWACWHYRYVGPDLAAFIDTYFAGVQYYALRFIRAWNEG